MFERLGTYGSGSLLSRRLEMGVQSRPHAPKDTRKHKRWLKNGNDGTSYTTHCHYSWVIFITDAYIQSAFYGAFHGGHKLHDAGQGGGRALMSLCSEATDIPRPRISNTVRASLTALATWAGWRSFGFVPRRFSALRDGVWSEGRVAEGPATRAPLPSSGIQLAAGQCSDREW